MNVLLPDAARELNPEDVSNHYRTLDMRRGTLLTGGSLVGIPGLAIHLRVLRLVSLDERAIGLQLIQLQVEEGDFDITFEASLDGLDFGLKADRLDQDAQKTVAAGIPVIVAVSAPTSLAVRSAQAAGLTLIARAGEGGQLIYAGAHRIHR